MRPPADTAADRRGRVARGIAWNTAYQVAEIGLAFLAMLVLVRVVPQEAYGRFGTVVGILTVLNALGFAGFAAQALLVPGDEEPDWSLHWAAGLYIQVALALVCSALAALCWLSPVYQPIAPLLHVAALGFVLDWPAQLRVVMLRRAMDFRRLKIVLACSVLLRIAVTLPLALAGAGAFALVLGGNVVSALPLGVDLLVVQGWRPRPGWWRGPDWGASGPALRFGAQQAGSALLGALRGGLEAAVLPHAVGYAAIGLLDRARAISGTTIGRAGHVLVETMFPLLPRSAADPPVFARQAALFVRLVALAVIPGVVYVGLEGRHLSRLLYGERWSGADPMIWPAALALLGLSVLGSGTAVLLAAGRLRAALVLDVALALVSAPMLAIAWAREAVVLYAWALAAGQLAAGAGALAAAAPLLSARGLRKALLPPAVATALATAVVLALQALGPALPLVPRLALDTSAYAAAVALALRGLFPSDLAALIMRAPGGPRLARALRLPA